MHQAERSLHMLNLAPDIGNELNPVEKSILTVLRSNNRQDRTIDVSWLQAECKHIGFSPKEFSHGFVRLLMRGHLEPCGEFAYALAAANRVEAEMSPDFGRTQTEEAPTPVPQHLQGWEEVSQQNRVGILLVDDDDDVRDVVTHMLESADYRVFSAENGMEAISAFRENQDSIDLLVSDVVMPKMNGREVYEQLRKLRPGLPAVFISGYPSDVLKHMEGEENVKLLVKPLNQTILVNTIQAALQS
ncbi:MAG: hypothetical protein A2X79_05930 [Desulfuromonadaceae bacterium GWB2_53_15]|nr:MAG: hypothetical protein A2X79_05930 [Desulfuromonadaceae bacterium GWB2_53_15]